MANMDVAPQVPQKGFKYRVTYLLKNGNVEEIDAPTATQEGLIDAATAKLNDAQAPTSSVSKITITIGNKAT